ncbi:CbtA family protein [Nocardioides aurantiacus]|uniref:Putative cobalt transporter CbtA n=1 Tax=Nocardioides aurantiacus TaxID=86796 RepID=A0A3N2CRY9_9ACTN|nr:CbtA family protein [Nocardioides aurantiacus]ROR90280.1 putative cobalt transporter CbtA [Nocardioides aurantiacus]
MTARTFLVRGLLAGLIAGLAAFAVAYVVGEPQVETAIGLESSAGASATEPHDHAPGTPAEHSHGDEDAVVSRTVQSTLGLLTGNLAVGIALGGLVGLASAFAVGRIGRLTPRQSTGLVALVGFVAFALVPFLKYPATPPAVGSGETIGDRTALYFSFVAISLAAAFVAVLVGRRTAASSGAYLGTVAGVSAYLLVVMVAGTLMPTVNEVGDFPADTLWFFRRASLLTLATLWAALGVALAGFVGIDHERALARQRRRELATSL